MGSSHGGGIIEFDFPASRQLIFGTDKAESDLLLNFRLRDTAKVTKRKAVPPPETGLLDSTAFAGLYVKKGLPLKHTGLSSDIYYERSKGKLRPTNNAEYPAQTAANLLTGALSGTSYRLTVTHRMYGHFTPAFEISLNDFNGFFADDFETYCRTEQVPEGRIKAVAVILNRRFQYAHLLLLEIEPDALGHADGTLSADLYTNIPLENIDLFLDK